MRLSPYREVPEKEWLTPLKPGAHVVKTRERVRQWLLNELADNYFFPRDWLTERVVFVDGQTPNQTVPADFFGFCLSTAKGDPFFWASLDTSQKSVKAEERLRGVLRHSPFSRLGISTDGTPEGTRCLRQRSNSDECDFVPDIEPFTVPEGLRLSTPYRAPGGKARGHELEPISSSLEDVFFEAHSHIRDIDGLHADEALDELCKVLYAKLFDEEQTREGDPYTLQRGLASTTEEFAASVRRIYLDANEYDVRVFSLKIPGYDRSRGVFNAPIRLSSPALVRVVESLAPYWLTRSSIDVKGRAFQRVLGSSMRAGMGQYFTPLEIINFMVDVTSPSVNDLILDPFAGSGHFLTRSLDFVRASSTPADEKRLHEFAFNKLHGIEKSDRMVRVAMTDMRLHGDGHSNVRCTDSLLDFSNYPDIHPQSFDLILTNPPFGSLLGPEALARLGRFEFAQGRRNVPLELLGLERCIQFLRPGGRLGIVLPDGVLANRGTEHVRQTVARWAKVRIIVSLPVEAFTPFGANIKTSILFLRKWKSGEKRTTDYPVHLIQVDSVGYDATGRVHANADLMAARDAAQVFLREEAW